MTQSEKTNRGLSFEDAVFKKYGGIKHIAFKEGEQMELEI